MGTLRKRGMGGEESLLSYDQEIGYNDADMFDDFTPMESGAEGAGVLAASKGNPALIAGMVGLKALEAYKARKERERMERYQAQVATSNRMQGALSKLANIGSAMKLG